MKTESVAELGCSIHGRSTRTDCCRSAEFPAASVSRAGYDGRPVREDPGELFVTSGSLSRLSGTVGEPRSTFRATPPAQLQPEVVVETRRACFWMPYEFPLAGRASPGGLGFLEKSRFFFKSSRAIQENSLPTPSARAEVVRLERRRGSIAAAATSVRLTHPAEKSTKVAMALAGGTHLSTYEILASLGSGGMGDVYLAKDRKLGRLVAIKVLRPGLASDKERSRRFEQEARSASALNHPNIVTIYEIGEHEGTQYIAMEYVEGETLRALMGDHPLPLRRLGEFAKQIAEGLAKAHVAGIVHRDLKPENIMVSRDGYVKILDFGLAKLRLEPSRVATDMSTIERFETQQGVVLGTFAYMSPEQAKGQPVDFRSDQFSLGAILYEMTTGRRPFERPSSAETLAAILEREPEPVVLRNPSVPPQFGRIVERCLSKDPQDRYDSTRDLARDIREAGTPALSVSRGATDRKPWHSIAVLPLKNLSSHPEQEYFVDGMTEALIADVAKIGALKVISRTSVMRYKGSDKPLSEIARELSVSSIVEGSVLRAGDRIRITVQLIDALKDAHLWAESYERELTNVLSLQGEVAQAIAQQVKVKLTPQEQARLIERRTVEPAAHDAYLRGRYHLNRATPTELTKAIHYFEEAVRLDTKDALAHAGLATAYNYLGWLGGSAGEVFPKAKQAARRAREIDENLAEAHAALGYTATFYDWDWATAEEALERAIALSPNYAEGYLHYSWYLHSQGRPEEARAAITRASELDPLSLIIHANMSNYYEFKRDYDGALAQTQRTLELAPNLPLALLFSGWAYCGLGQHDVAVRQFEKLVELGGSGFKGNLGYAYAKAGCKEAALAILDELTALPAAQQTSSWQLTLVFLGLDRFDEALTQLERAFEEHSGPMFPYLRQVFYFDPLREHPRFRDLVRRLNFPQ